MPSTMKKLAELEDPAVGAWLLLQARLKAVASKTLKGV